MPKVPVDCGRCRYKRRMNMPGDVIIWECGHRGGPTSDGKPGFIEVKPFAPLPSWCPLRNGAEFKVHSVIFGKTKFGGK